MSFVILGHCCKDGSCLRVCPQHCIGPTPDDPAFATVEQLTIDPGACIGCSACVDACPVAAIKPVAALTDAEQVYARPVLPVPPTRRPARPEIPVALRSARDPIRVAVVGAGSAAMYTVRELLQRSSAVRVTVFERGAHVGGLLRTAVSPDHPEIRQMTRLFDLPFADPRVETRFGTRVGVDVTIDDLRGRYDAVILAFGATAPRAVAGASIPQVHQAIDLLTEANAAQRERGVPAARLAGPTVAIVGGGNVAVDVVTGLARQRLVTRSGAPVTRAIVVARAPACRPSFSFSALHELRQLDVDITVDPGDAASAPGPLDHLLSELGPRARSRPGLAVEVIFGREVTALHPADGHLRVDTVRTDSAHRTAASTLTADAVVLAAGFTCAPLPGIPLGPDGAVANRDGRVVSPETGDPIAGLYVVGWAKRGGRGGVGENRRCAAQTVDLIAADLAAVPTGA
ncbi:FAD-dependent oxidoreductase [Nocardia sp. AG03]|uniref:FAD-dependent oxidoreductase n=1 Tax=Nocardia sp. AG03 TaxID=3025312 RepID=UPI0024187BE0|nr:FAD-dependent oxidoreductase [Nocardia sp. AG03]